MTPLCNVFLMMQNTPRARVNLAGLQLELLPTELAPAKFDLELMVGEVIHGMGGLLAYSTDLFDGPTIARMATRFQDFLRAAANQPEGDITTLAGGAKTENKLVDAFKLQEVAKYFIDVPMGASWGHIIVMNTNKYASLSADQKKVIDSL